MGKVETDCYTFKNDVGKNLYRKKTYYTLVVEQDVLAKDKDEADTKFTDHGGIAHSKITKDITDMAMPILEYMLDVLGLKLIKATDGEIKSVFELTEKRDECRKNKQFEDADAIRDEISGMGIHLIDHKEKTLWMKKEEIKADS